MQFFFLRMLAYVGRPEQAHEADQLDELRHWVRDVTKAGT